MSKQRENYFYKQLVPFLVGAYPSISAAKAQALGICAFDYFSVLLTFITYFVSFFCGFSSCSFKHEIVHEKNSANLSVYLNEIEKATITLCGHKKSIQKILSNDPNCREILAIGFPEVIRWNEFQDMIEISFDKSIYVNFGSKKLDFSIGLFQMKPSFIENLESYVKKYPLVFPHVIVMTVILEGKEEKKNRLIRIQRLSNTEWQLRYLSVYWRVVNHKFRYIIFKNNSQKLKFYAAAYNFGFTKPISQIQNWQSKKLFPYGKNYEKIQVAYSDISLLFFQSHSQIFNQTNY